MQLLGTRTICVAVILALSLIARQEARAQGNPPKKESKGKPHACDHSRPPPLPGAVEHMFTSTRELRSSTRQLFTDAGLKYPPRRIYLRAFKTEDQLELWAAARGKLKRVKTYKICAKSGTLGPKRAEGDGQVPEGFYHVKVFNSRSHYHASLGLNYPNRSDRILGNRKRPGSHIFIHGECVTIGCIPIENGPIDELFQIALDARRAGQRKIPVHIFPRRMDDDGMKALGKYAPSRPDLMTFWRGIRPGYQLFESTRKVPRARILRSGKYVISRGR